MQIRLGIGLEFHDIFQGYRADEHFGETRDAQELVGVAPPARSYERDQGPGPRHFADGRFGTRQQVDTLFGYPLPLAQLFGQYFFDAVDAVVLGNKLRTGNHACA